MTKLINMDNVDKKNVFFTRVEVKQLLETYTERIIEEVELDTDSAYNVIVNKESITKQLPEFLKEIGL